MVSRKICRGCCHWRRQKTGALGPHCGYLMDTGQSRIAQMTAEQRKSGECPCFEKGRQRKTTAKAFIVSPDPLSRLSYGLPGIPKPRRPKYDEAEKRSFDSLSLAQDDRGGVARSAADQDDSKKEVATT